MKLPFKRIVLWGFPLLLVGWAASQFRFQETGEVFRGISFSQIGLLLLINCLIFLLFAVRWWILIRGSGSRVSFRSVVRYRLTAFGITCFTPRPQFGGEPYQVFALTRKSGFSKEAAVSSVSLDKLIELIANFSFLVFGLAIILSGGYLPKSLNMMVLTVLLVFLFLTSIYIFLLRLGIRPLTTLLQQAAGFRYLHRFLGRVQPWELDIERDLYQV